MGGPKLARGDQFWQQKWSGGPILAAFSVKIGPAGPILVWQVLLPCIMALKELLNRLVCILYMSFNTFKLFLPYACSLETHCSVPYVYFCPYTYGPSHTRMGVYYFAERNGTERLIPLNTNFTEQLKNKPKQLPTLEFLLWIGCRCIPSKYNGIIADVLNKYIHGLSGVSKNT